VAVEMVKVATTEVVAEQEVLEKTLQVLMK
jgi:hypothetical protein